ncbi:hypothetical protein GCM10010400_46400 [Streptomyces aculeolatus]
MRGRVGRRPAPGVAAGVDLADEEGIRRAYALHGAELYRFAFR